MHNDCLHRNRKSRSLYNKLNGKKLLVSRLLHYNIRMQTYTCL